MTMSIQTHVEPENFVKIAQLLYFQWQICGKIRSFQFFAVDPHICTNKGATWQRGVDLHIIYLMSICNISIQLQRNTMMTINTKHQAKLVKTSKFFFSIMI